MLECLSFKSFTLTPPTSTSLPTLPPPPPPPPHSLGNSTDGTPATSTRSSPTPTVSREYDLAVQANSYNEIRSMIQAPSNHQLEVYVINNPEDPNDDVSHHHQQLLSQVLQPDRESVREALAGPIPTRRSIPSRASSPPTSTAARTPATSASSSTAASTAPAADSSSLSRHHCDRAYDIFVEFDRQDNPFVFLDCLHTFTTIRRSFSDLKQQIENRRRKSQSRIKLIRRSTAGCVTCLILTAVGTVVSTVVVTTHAVAGFACLAAAPFCNRRGCIPHPKKSERKELAKLKQLNAAAKSTYVVKDLDTIDSLVDKLQTAVEGDKNLIRFAVVRGRERHPIQEVLKQLIKNQQSFQNLLEDLEEHIFLFFNTVNKARLSLLQEISIHRNL